MPVDSLNIHIILQAYKTQGPLFLKSPPVLIIYFLAKSLYYHFLVLQL